MATLERIRNKAGILVAVIIGLSLLAFILTDLLDSRKSFFTGAKLEVAEISGSSVSYQILEEKINSLTEIYKLNSGQSAVDEKTSESIREQAWNTLINEYVMNEEYNNLGLTVSADEIFDLVQGANPHPIIMQLFTNQETGQFNKAGLMQFLKNMDQDQTGKQKTYWLAIESEIQTQRLNDKYTNLIRKGLTAPKFMAKNDFIESNRKSNVSFIVERFNTISDSLVKVTPSDLKEYYNKHKYLYEQNTSRDIEYVTFDVVASEDDRQAAFEWISKIKEDFSTTEEVESFVNANSDQSYTDKNYKKEELPDSIRDFVSNAKVGDIYGPYLEGESFKLAKLYKTVNIPDSVKARHILIRPKGQTQQDVIAAKNLADSLKTLIEKAKGSNFDALALQYSDDRSNSQKGGDLGWFKEGSMVKPFNDAAFEGTKGEYKVVETNFGYHILQVTERGKEIDKVKVAYLERKISPSSQTFQNTYAKAIKFAGENLKYESFNAAITKQNLNKRYASIGESDRTIPGIESPRQVIRWAYQAEENEVSEPLDLGNTYLVAVLTQVKEKGTASLKQVKNEVELAVRKQKKAEKIKEKINTAKSGVTQLQDLALKLNLPVETAEGVAFSSYTLGNSGFEPKVVAYASFLQKGKISEPIEGTSGIYVVVADAVNEAPESDYLANTSRLNYAFQSRATYDSKNALIKLANIEDKRYKFY